MSDMKNMQTYWTEFPILLV